MTGRSTTKAEQKARAVSTVAFFIPGMSVVLSYDRQSGNFVPGAWLIISIGVLIAPVILIAFWMTLRRPRGCPACGHPIPFDANPCPYCGHALR